MARAQREQDEEDRGERGRVIEQSPCTESAMIGLGLSTLLLHALSHGWQQRRHLPPTPEHPGDPV